MSQKENTVNSSYNDYDSSQSNGNKTPKHTTGQSSSQKTPNENSNNSAKVTRGKSKKREVTPSRNPNYGGVGGGDRFIPNRSATQFEYANHCLVQHNCENDSAQDPSSEQDPTKASEKALKIKMMRGSSSDIDDNRILCYKKSQAPLPPLGNNLKVLYTATSVLPTMSAKKGIRHIPQSPERILDAPNFMDDFYLNLLDWGGNNVIAVALTNSLYMWNAATGEITTLFEIAGTTNLHITSVKWAGGGSFLAAGLSDGQIKLFDPSRRNTVLRTMQSQSTRVGCLSWRQHILSAGCRSGQIYHHDVRVPAHYLDMFDGHTQEVCGLVWNESGQYLASGGADTVVNVWDPSGLGTSNSTPLHKFDDHLASVKAIAFNPHQAHSLATGGGTSDRCIKFWNLASGTLCQSKQTESQINAIAFTSHYRELITAHGYACNALNIWKYPSMRPITTLHGHTERVLALAMSPCGQYVMSASGDESLRLWWCFRIDKNNKKESSSKNSSLVQSVR